jgi:hypothetical protein
MRHPALSILWEVCARERWATIFVLAALPFCFLLNVICAHLEPNRSIPLSFPVDFIVLLLATATIFWTFSFSEGDFRRGKTSGFPPYTFTLPVRTSHLVSIRVAGGILTLLAFYFGWMTLIFPFWRVPLPHLWLPIQVLALASMMVVTQAIAWSLNAFPWIRLIALAIALIGLGWLAIVVPSEEFRMLSPTALALGFAGVTVVGWLAAVFGVARDRRGEWVGWTSRLWQQILDLRPVGRTAFPSAVAAQFWFERSRKMAFASILFSLPIVGMVALLPLVSFIDPARHGALSIVWMLPLLLVTASTVGQGIAKSDYWSREQGINLFLAIRPMSTGSFVMAKLKVSTLISLLGFALIVIASPFAFSLLYLFPRPDLELPSWSLFQQQNADALRWISDPVVIALTIGVTWHSMVSGLSVGLLGHSRKTLVINVVGLTLLTGMVSGGAWLYLHPAWERLVFPVLPWIAAVILILKGSSAFLAFRSIKNRGLLSRKQFWVLGVIWLGVVILFLGGSWGALSHHNLIIPGPVLIFLLAWFLPSSELPNCVLHMSSDRHR